MSFKSIIFILFLSLLLIHVKSGGHHGRPYRPVGSDRHQRPNDYEFPEGSDRHQRPNDYEFPEGSERPQRPGNAPKFFQDFLTCILNQSENKIEDLVVNNLKNLIDNYSASHLSEIYKIINSIKEQVPFCLLSSRFNSLFNRQSQQERINESYKTRYNWDNFIKCFTENINQIVEEGEINIINNVISLVKNGEFLKAIQKYADLVKIGSKIITTCSLV